MALFDTVVVGAGAAGIAAGRPLRRAGLSVVLLEARDRVGGRAWTDESLARHPVELGAEFIHGENVATWDWLREVGAPATGEAHRGQMWFHVGGQLLDDEAFYLLAGDLYRDEHRLQMQWRELGEGEISLAALFDRWGEFFGGTLSDELRALVDNMAAQGWSSDPEAIGVIANASATFKGDGRLRHSRLLRGYSALMRTAARELDIRTGEPVTRIRWGDGGVEITSTRGSYRAADAIVTLPLGVLRAGDVQFEPSLPEAKRSAIETINTGAIGKVVLKFDRVYWPPGMTFAWTPLDTQLWWRPGQGQPEEEPIITAFFGGRDALRFGAMRAEETARAAVDDLQEMLGKRLHDRVVDSRVICWNNELYTKMGYTSLPPGGAGLREALAQPVGPLHFAGEATNAIRPSTVHGAIESGRRAAAEVLAARSK